MKKTYNDTPDTLLAAILALQDKILENKDEFLSAELSILCEMGDGRIISRPNPAVQEYRALVKDFASALRAYEEIFGGNKAEVDSKLADIRARLKVIV